MGEEITVCHKSPQFFKGFMARGKSCSYSSRDREGDSLPRVPHQSSHHTAWVALGSSNSALSSIPRSIKPHPLLEQTEGWRGMGWVSSRNTCCSGKSSRNFWPQAKCWFHPLPPQLPQSRVRANRELHRHLLAGETHYAPKTNTFKIKITILPLITRHGI